MAQRKRSITLQWVAIHLLVYRYVRYPGSDMDPEVRTCEWSYFPGALLTAHLHPAAANASVTKCIELLIFPVHDVIVSGTVRKRRNRKCAVCRCNLHFPCGLFASLPEQSA